MPLWRLNQVKQRQLKHGDGVGKQCTIKLPRSGTSPGRHDDFHADAPGRTKLTFSFLSICVASLPGRQCLHTFAHHWAFSKDHRRGHASAQVRDVDTSAPLREREPIRRLPHRGYSWRGPASPAGLRRGGRTPQKQSAMTASGNANATHDAASHTLSPRSAESKPQAMISAISAGNRKTLTVECREVTRICSRPKLPSALVRNPMG